MSHSGGYRTAIRERLRRYGVIHEVLRKHHRLKEAQELIYNGWFKSFKSNDIKKETLRALFYTGPNDSEAIIFDRVIPWHILSPIQKRNYSKLGNWISYYENMHK